jgi:hypothetical protein
MDRETVSEDEYEVSEPGARKTAINQRLPVVLSNVCEPFILGGNGVVVLAVRKQKNGRHLPVILFIYQDIEPCSWKRTVREVPFLKYHA